jgi:hypothetical protein
MGDKLLDIESQDHLDESLRYLVYVYFWLPNSLGVEWYDK